MKIIDRKALVAALIIACVHDVCGMDLDETPIAGGCGAAAGAGGPGIPPIVEPDSGQHLSLSGILGPVTQMLSTFLTVRDLETLCVTDINNETVASWLLEMARPKETWRNFIDEGFRYEPMIKKEEFTAKVNALSKSDVIRAQAELKILVAKAGNAHPITQCHFLQSIFTLFDAGVSVTAVLEIFPDIQIMEPFSFESILECLSNIIKSIGIENAKHYIDRFSSGAELREKGYILLRLNSVFERTGASARYILDTVINHLWTPAQQREILGLISNSQGHYLPEILTFAGKGYDEISEILKLWRSEYMNNFSRPKRVHPM